MIKIGLILLLWGAMLGWFGNVVRKGDPPIAKQFDFVYVLSISLGVAVMIVKFCCWGLGSLVMLR